VTSSAPATRDVGPVDPVGGNLDAQLLDIFFDQVPMGVAVFDLDRRLLRCNKTWAGFFTHYLGAPADYASPGRRLEELLPGNEEALAPLLQEVLAGRQVRQAAHRLAADGIVTYWDVVFAPTFTDGRVSGFVDIVTDATSRVLAVQRLERRVQAFTEIAAGMTVDQPVERTLRDVVTAVRRTVDAFGCSIVSWADDERGGLAAYGDDGLPDGYVEGLRRAWAALPRPDTTATDLPRVAVLGGFRRDGLTRARFDPLHEYWRTGGWDDLVVVPLLSQGRCLGELHLYLPEGARLSEDDETFLAAVADQAAVAVQNAALFAAAEGHAALVERQRLARDLHDSVSQALFSMTLHARTAQRHLAAAGLPVDSAVGTATARLSELAQGALAEMRALIFELRPGALAQEGLVAALQRQAAALTAREGLPIRVSGPAERPALTGQAEEHLYRLVLEALHNTIKHAAADSAAVTVSVEADGRELAVCIADDGIGFDIAAVPPGHLGQQTMRERAEAIGGRMTVDTAPGAGCRISLRVPLAR
jgi:signal transduction histidine kinase